MGDEWEAKLNKIKLIWTKNGERLVVFEFSHMPADFGVQEIAISLDALPKYKYSWKGIEHTAKLIV